MTDLNDVQAVGQGGLIAVRRGDGEGAQWAVLSHPDNQELAVYPAAEVEDGYDAILCYRIGRLLQGGDDE